MLLTAAVKRTAKTTTKEPDSDSQDEYVGRIAMKRNGFGDAYCQTADEARREIESSESGWECYLGEIDPPEPPRFGATAAILGNESGDTICYLEAENEAGIRALAKELKLQTGY